ATWWPCSTPTIGGSRKRSNARSRFWTSARHWPRSAAACAGSGRRMKSSGPRSSRKRRRRSPPRARTAEPCRAPSCASAARLRARRALFDDVGLVDTELRAAEDWDMWLRIAARHDIDNVPDPLTNIYEHRTGMFRKARLIEESLWRVYHKAIASWPELLDWRT